MTGDSATRCEAGDSVRGTPVATHLFSAYVWGAQKFFGVLGAYPEGFIVGQDPVALSYPALSLLFNGGTQPVVGQEVRLWMK